MPYRKVNYYETECPECGNQTHVVEENGQQIYEMHYRRDPLTKNIQWCHNSRRAVTSKVRLREMLVVE